MNQVILHIDYDSFFASVEQQANPHLRGRPIAITGSSTKKGVACTASIEAKRLGIKTGMPIFKVKELCPKIIVIKGDFKRYTYIHKESLKIFNKYTDLVEPFSIDEAFLDVTKTLKFFDSPIHIANLIKKDIKQKFGPFITCSIGIGPNKLLAKLVSDFNKPNGIFVVNKENMHEVLKSANLSDFCGIGHQIIKRLEKINIKTVSDLKNTPLQNLYKEFGNVTGSFLKNLSYGIDYSRVKPIGYKRSPKSISHQHTLYKNTKDMRIIKSNLLSLTNMVCKRLRNNNMYTSMVFVVLKNKDGKTYAKNQHLYEPTNISTDIYKIVSHIVDQLDFRGECRFVSVGLSKLAKKQYTTINLFPQNQIKQKINTTIDKINDKWGDFTLRPASTLTADTQKDKMSSFLKHG